MSMHMAQADSVSPSIIAAGPPAKATTYAGRDASDPQLAPAKGIATAVLMSVPFWLAAGITLYLFL